MDTSTSQVTSEEPKPAAQDPQPVLYIIPTSEAELVVQAQAEKPRCKPVTTLQDYRRHVGMKVHNQKAREKIGIKVRPFTYKTRV